MRAPGPLVTVATCVRCGDEVGADGCPTCGDWRPENELPSRSPATSTSNDASATVSDAPLGAVDALLARVQDALEAHAHVARQRSVNPAPTAESRLARRLRRQAVLIADALADHEQLGSRLRDALGRVERALQDEPPAVPEARAPLVDVALPRTDGCAELARRQVTRHAAEVLDEQAVADAVLITSELVDNACAHGRGRITLRLVVIGDRLRIEVADEGQPTWIGVHAQVDGGTGGWGLWIVERLSLEWGVQELSARVWADLPLRGSSAAIDARDSRAERLLRAAAETGRGQLDAER